MKFDIIILTILSVVAGQTDEVEKQGEVQANVSGYNVRCPPKDAKCNYNYRTFTPVDKDAPQCWSLSYGRWSCSSTQYSADCPYGKKNIKDCSYPKPNPECPKPGDICQFNYRRFKASDSNAPACWVKKNYHWECKNPAGGKSCDADKGEANVRECIKPPNDKCPKFGDKCKDSYGKEHEFLNLRTPKCWKKNGYSGYLCSNPSYGSKCNSDEVDVFSCPVAEIHSA